MAVVIAGSEWSTARLVGPPVSAAAVAAALTVASGYPYWAQHPGAGGLAAALAACLAAVGATLATQRDQPEQAERSGAFLLLSALAFSLAWLFTRNTGLAPALGECAGSAFFLALGAGLLVHGQGPLRRSERSLLALAVLVLAGAQAAMLLLCPPTALGYAPDIDWPNVSDSLARADLVLRASGVAYLVLGTAFAAVLLARRPVTAHPLFLTGGVLAILFAAIQFPVMHAGAVLGDLVAAHLAQAGAATAIPLALFADSVRTTRRARAAGDRLLQLAAPPTHGTVQRALTLTLGHPGLRVWIWLPTRQRYVDTDGHTLSFSAPLDEPGIRRYEVTAESGAPLGLCELTSPAQPQAIAQALAVARPALHAVQAQAVHYEEMRDVHVRLLEAEQEGRREVARNLHDGVQQHLAALKMDVHRLARLAGQPELRDQALECAGRIDEITEELRAITRGMNPPTLSEHGLGPALEENAERLGRRVELEIPAVRMHPRLEMILYYALTEALTNADKHAGAARVRVRLSVGGDEVVAKVQDDGAGGAAITLGGGLHGVEDRVRAVRGRLEIVSPRGGGTELTIVIPAEMSSV